MFLITGFLNKEKMLKEKLQLHKISINLLNFGFFVIYILSAIFLNFLFSSVFVCESDLEKQWNATFAEEAQNFLHCSVSDKQWIIEREKTKLWYLLCPHTEHYINPVLQKYSHYLDFMPEQLAEKHKYLNQVYEELHATRHRAEFEDCGDQFFRGFYTLSGFLFLSLVYLAIMSLITTGK